MEERLLYCKRLPARAAENGGFVEANREGFYAGQHKQELDR